LCGCCAHRGNPTALRFAGGRLTHFLKVTRNYREGLFYCYDDDAIPRTNNELEQYFGQHRYHERRATGRKRGSVNTVLHGPVRLVASAMTRLRPFTAVELAPPCCERWQRQRKAVRERFARRAQGRRFRSDPGTYLAQLEQACLGRRLLIFVDGLLSAVVIEYLVYLWCGCGSSVVSRLAKYSMR
jgi:hypothetical protein